MDPFPGDNENQPIESNSLEEFDRFEMLKNSMEKNLTTPEPYHDYY